MGQWPIHTQRLISTRANTPGNKKPLSGAFTHRYFGGALAQDYTAYRATHATAEAGYFSRFADALPMYLTAGAAKSGSRLNMSMTNQPLYPGFTRRKTSLSAGR